MPTKTAETVHGSVEYETVECASCGNETVVDDAKDFQIGDREGKACEHCYKEGPISFPTGLPINQQGSYLTTAFLWPFALLVWWDSSQSKFKVGGSIAFGVFVYAVIVGLLLL